MINNIIYLSIPKVCPICGGATKIVESDSGVLNLICENPQCQGKLINRLEHFCSKKGLEIKGLSKNTLEKLIDWGWINGITDLYNLKTHAREWEKQPGFGKASVNKLLNAIEQSKKCELTNFISALGIPLIGSTYAKQIAQKEFDWHNFRECVEGHFNFTTWDGFGPEMCSALWKFDYTEADELVKLFNITNSLWKDPNQKSNSELEGINIVITGKLNLYKNRTELQKAIENAGGKVVGSVSKNTNYLINNDSTSSSSKNLSAKKLGIPILTEAEFIEKFLEND